METLTKNFKIQKNGTDVFVTDEYDLFKTKQGNRKIDQALVKKIYKSIEQHGWFKSSLIIVGDNLVVLDGQHRIEALKMFSEKHGVKYKVKYIVDRDMDNMDCIRAWQTERKGWTNDDYTKSFIEQGNVKYQLYSDFRNEYKLNHTISLALLANSAGSGNAQSFKSGKIKIFNIVLAKKLAENLIAIGKYYEYYQHSMFVTAMLPLWNNPEFDNQRFVKNLSKNRDSLYRVSSAIHYRRMIEDIYNYYKHDKVRFD